MPSAGIWIRLKAFALDYIWIFLHLCFILLLSTVLLPEIQNMFTGSPVIAQLTGFLLVTLPISLYFAVGDSSVFKGTFGKRKMKVRVVNQEERPAGLPQSLLRIVLKFLPWELSHFLIYRLMYLEEGEFPLYLMVLGGLVYALMFAYILTAVFSKDGRTLYDWISGTKVIRI